MSFFQNLKKRFLKKERTTRCDRCRYHCFVPLSFPRTTGESRIALICQHRPEGYACPYRPYETHKPCPFFKEVCYDE